MFSSKKGAVFHWIVFGLIFAVGLYFYLSGQSTITTPVRGIWSSQFLEDTYYPFLKDELGLAAKAKNIASQELLEITSSGGVFDKNDCTNPTPYPFWNRENQFCFPQAKTLFITRLGPKLQSAYPQYPKLEVGVVGEELYGKASPYTLKQTTNFFASYTYTPSFSLNLGYNFEEFVQIEEEALGLINTCRNVKELESCLAQQRKTHWTIGPCSSDSGQFSQVPRTQRFCVSSPNKYTIFSSDGLIVPLIYKFSLDFTQTSGIVVSNIQVSENEQLYELTFPFDQSPSSYTIYYTNYPNAKEKKGTPSTIFGDFFSTYAWGSLEIKQSAIINEISFCTDKDSRLFHTAYLCNEKLIYMIDKATLPDLTSYFFTVTATKNSEESEIVTWAS